MKKVPKLLVLAFFAAWMITLTGCKKDAEFPTLTTTAVSDITPTSVATGGSVNFSGGAEVTERGVCWGISHNPTIDLSKTFDGTGSGTFTSVIAGLIPNTSYYVRAYATNKAGTFYGNEIFFTSPGPVTTTAIVSYSSTSAVVTCKIFYPQTGYQLIGSGVCWGTSPKPTTKDNKTMNDSFSGIFTSNLTGLEQGTIYYVRAFGEYDDGSITYGNQLYFTTSFGPGTGTQKADFPGGARNKAVGFSIGSKVYVGLGYFETIDNGTFYKDFWEWDQTNNVWTKKADYPGALTDGADGFSIGTKGYVETGIDYSTLHVTSEFWEYDPATDKWAEKSSIPSVKGRSLAVGFSIGTKGYIGTGYWQEGTSLSYYKDFWEWDQTTDVWTQKADFPGNARSAAVGFSIGNKGYIGTGNSSDGTAVSYYQDYWEWDQATDAWTQKAKLPGNGLAGAVGFSIGNKGYIGTGFNNNTSFNKKDFWEWDQSTNVWIQKANLAGDGRAFAVGFSIGNKGYVATGNGGNPDHYLQDLWEYDPTVK